MNLQNSFWQKRRALALPMTLAILLFGSILVATAFYIVQNMYSTSRHAVTHTELYNAAQSGIEKARSLLIEDENWKKIDIQEREYDRSIDSLRVQLENANSNEYLDDILQEMQVAGLPGVKVTVDILDCNYVFGDGIDGYDDLDANQIASLPPRWRGGEGEGIGGVVDIEGTSVIIDPTRFFQFGGGAGDRRYVIRSTAFEKDNGQQISIEVMVVVKR